MIKIYIGFLIYWIRANPLERWRTLVRISKNYYNKNKIDIDKLYREEHIIDNKKDFSHFPLLEKDHWTYIPQGSKYEN